MKHNEFFVCPRTHKPLVRIDQHLTTTDDGNRYPIIHDVPFFLKYSGIETELQRPTEVVEMNVLAPKLGWKAAMEMVYGSGSGMMSYSANAQRAKFLDLLNLSGSEDVLELGIGFGQQTVELAKKVRSLHAIDVVLQNALFAKHRCVEEGLENVTLCCGGDDNLLPYPDNFFDMVVMNLVFEWAASRNRENPGLAGQNILLKEANRVLKPGGILYLNTKNRYALRLLLGKRDEHAHNMRFGHALPRFLMTLLLSISGHKQAVGTLQSYTSLRDMLIGTGFSITNSYWAIPEMRYPTHFVNTDTSEVKRFRSQKTISQGEFRSTRLLMPLIPPSLVKHLTPGLLFLARKN